LFVDELSHWREALNIMLSMSHGTDRQSLKAAAREFATSPRRSSAGDDPARPPGQPARAPERTNACREASLVRLSLVRRLDHSWSSNRFDL
jgi:hypothetical protein